jgi:hypothetical protein
LRDRTTTTTTTRGMNNGRSGHRSTNIVKLHGTVVQPGPARTQIDTRVSSWVDGGEWERNRGHEHEHTPKEQRQKRTPALSPTRTSRLPTLRPSVPVDLMLDQALHICMFNNSTSHPSTIPIPSSIQLNSPPTAYNSRLYQALLVAVCLSPDLDHAPLC